MASIDRYSTIDLLSLTVSFSEQIALEIRTTIPEIISITSSLVYWYISAHLSRIFLATFTACAVVTDFGSGGLPY